MKKLVLTVLAASLAACSGTSGGGTAGTAAIPPSGVSAQARIKSFAMPAFIKGVNYAPTPICKTSLDNPLGNKNSAVWKRDLKILRTLGVNSVKVYNTNPNAEPITDFLKDAYNGGSNPIYVILSIFFPATVPLDKGAVADLSEQYRKLAFDNGANPDVIGISISSEVNAENVRSNPSWWQGMNEIARAARDGFRKAGHPEKILTTTMVDDGFITEREGEKYGFPIDVWGIDFYTGSTFGTKFSEYRHVSSKPLIVAEYGTPESWHPNGDPYKAVEFPTRKVSELTKYVGGLATEVYQNSTLKGGVVLGGYYFEYSDEWWKAGDDCVQLPSPEAPNPKFPGGFEDQAWFGLSSIAPGTPNVLTQRPAFTKLKAVFATQ